MHVQTKRNSLPSLKTKPRGEGREGGREGRGKERVSVLKLKVIIPAMHMQPKWNSLPSLRTKPREGGREGGKEGGRDVNTAVGREGREGREGGKGAGTHQFTPLRCRGWPFTRSSPASDVHTKEGAQTGTPATPASTLSRSSNGPSPSSWSTGAG